MSINLFHETDSDPIWTAIAARLIILCIVAVLTVVGFFGPSLISSATERPAACQHLTSDECAAKAEGGW